MNETPDKAVADRRLLDAVPTPAWAGLMQRLGLEHAEAEGRITRFRDWRGAVADVVVGRLR